MFIKLLLILPLFYNGTNSWYAFELLTTLSLVALSKFVRVTSSVDKVVRVYLCNFSNDFSAPFQVQAGAMAMQAKIEMDNN